MFFEAIHYTPEKKGAPILHGHTFRVDVEAEGEIGENGMVIDFRILRDAAREVLESWHMSIILPESAEFRAMGEFSYRVKRIPYQHATTEYMALTLAEELKQSLCSKLGVKQCKKLAILRVRLWESIDRYVEVEVKPS